MRSVIVILFTFFVLSLQRPADEGSVNAKILKLQNVLDPNGEYHFEFELSDGTKRQEKSVLKKASDGTDYLAVEGSYSFTDPQGMIYTVYYVADESGYHTKPFAELKPIIESVSYISSSILASLAGSGV